MYLGDGRTGSLLLLAALFAGKDSRLLTHVELRWSKFLEAIINN